MKKLQVILLSSGVGLVTITMITVPILNNYVWNKPKFEFISHRGVANKYMQNTVAALQAAANIDTYIGIETDVWKTSDDQFVCSHDPNPFGGAVYEPYIPNHSYNEIEERKIDLAYSHYRYIDKTDLRVPLLEYYLNICKSHNKKAYIEIKQPSRVDINGSKYEGPFLNKEDIEALVKLVSDRLDMSNFAFMAFDQQELLWVHTLNPNIECYQLLATSGLYYDMTGRSYIDDLANDAYNWLNWNISEFETTILTIQRIHKVAGRKIIVFPFVQIDLPLTWRTFANAGADFILTDKDPKYVI